MQSDTPTAIWQEIYYPWYQLRLGTREKPKRIFIPIDFMRFQTYEVVFIKENPLLLRYHIERVITAFCASYSVDVEKLVVLSLSQKKNEQYMSHSVAWDGRMFHYPQHKFVDKQKAIAILQNRINPHLYFAKRNGTASAAPNKLKKPS